ncbi:putative flippase GtrA [Prauserella shujinwangii]|uniref:Putative flippase GtrA n=1 Tax=Prauserella shujinwangii TaxID=1453103 RepID=A0A2T0LTZ5_9PSEU|nr:GtrA family protein [Prauserella shujinwangii]PRX47210.1 putative flippase GtrA [Prauserella shujinwangii]
MAMSFPAYAIPGTVRRPVPSGRSAGLGRHAVWYVAAGAVTTLLQALLFLALREPLGSLVANLLAIAVTTVANTEFHRLVTFAGASTRPARESVQAMVAFAFYAGSGSLVLLMLHGLADSPSALLETVALGVTSAVGGIARFLVLRYWVFPHGPRRTAKMTV